MRELYSFLLASYLPMRYPTIFKLHDNDTVENTATKAFQPTACPTDPLLALRILGETVEDDLFLLVETPAGHRCVALMCCFPSGFDPSEKLGKVLADIHGPVPSYHKIGGSMERFFKRLEVGKSVKRINVRAMPPSGGEKRWREESELIVCSGPSQHTETSSTRKVRSPTKILTSKR